MTDHCVVCGMEIPEGRQVCPMCATVAGTVKKAGAYRPLTNEQVQEATHELLEPIWQAGMQHKHGLKGVCNDTDISMYRTLADLHYFEETRSPLLMTVLRGLDMVGYRLQVVPK